MESIKILILSSMTLLSGCAYYIHDGPLEGRNREIEILSCNFDRVDNIRIVMSENDNRKYVYIDYAGPLDTVYEAGDLVTHFKGRSYRISLDYPESVTIAYLKGEPRTVTEYGRCLRP